MEGVKEDGDGASWQAWAARGVELVISDKWLGLVEALGECFPQERWVVPFYRNSRRLVPTSKVREVMALLKAICAQARRFWSRPRDVTPNL
jgi:putative transposase